ncbi:MAG: DUF5329 family protein [Chthoniobacterales bacterium]
MQRLRKFRSVGLLLIPALAFAVAGQALAAESLEQTIDYLLNYIGNSNATFIRNGQTHTPAEAVAHVRDKYDHFKGEIKTAEDFIRLAASKSLLTGKPYLVRPPGGREMHLDEWLTDALKAHRGKTNR